MTLRPMANLVTKLDVVLLPRFSEGALQLPHRLGRLT